MSDLLKAGYKGKPGTRVPSHLLKSAVAWENTRVQVFTLLGRDADAQKAAGLQRNYERRLQEETDLH